MSRRVTVGILVILLSLFLPPAACPSAFAASEAESAIAVAGNRHIDASMIRSHFHAGADGRFDAAALDAALKSLYATGLFQDVTVSRDGDRILVKVVENPTIERMAFEGNKKIKDEDLKKAVQSKAGGALARAVVHGDAERIIELYRQRGYFAVRVDPKTIRARDERVNLVFEITEGDKLAVRQILFIGNNAYAANKLKGEIKSGETNLLSFLLDNDVYNADRIEGDLDLLRRFYLAHGYADARVHSAASYETDRKGIVLTFSIEEGPRYRLGRVEVVSDLKAVDAAALNRYLRTQAGETYNADAVNKTVEDATIGLAKNGEPFAAVLVRSERVPASAASANAGGDRAGISSTPSSPANASMSSASTFTATPRRAMR
jgi:outer membrane protein insertion porin family